MKDCFGGAFYNSGGVIAISNSTFSGNSADRGGAIDNGLGTITISASIVAHNIATVPAPNGFGSTISTSYNLSNDPSCGFNSIGDDQCDALSKPTDQRGNVRLQGGGCDSGAVEVDATTPVNEPR